MIKRLFIIGLLTGIGHYVTLLSLKYISERLNDSTMAFIGKIDSLSLLIISIIAFGLQLSTTRDLALLDNWKKEYYSTQSARITLSLALSLFGFLGFFFSKNYLFFIAPIIALNADYALYGRGKPITAALIALLRVLIPTLTLMFSSIYYLNYLVLNYSISILFTYLITGVLVAKILKVTYFIKPSIKNLSKYLIHFRIGLASFAFFFIGIGIINVLSFFYNDTSLAIAYVSLKLYMIFKGIRRIIVQSFYKELTEVLVAIKIDYFAMIVGIVFLISLTLFQETVVLLLFDEKYVTYIYTFSILGFAGFLSSLTTSSGTRLLLKKQDKQYSDNLIIAAIITVVLSILFWFLFGNKPYLISLSILIGELILSILNIISLNEKKYIVSRFKIIYPLFGISLLIIPVTMFFTESIITFTISLTIFGLLAIFHTKKRLNFL